MSAPPSPAEVVVAYHERTKHHFHAYAASSGYLDWARQPDPFRRYQGAPFVPLPLPRRGHPVAYDALYGEEAPAAVPLSVDAVSRLLRYALSITAWKQVGTTRWALRANPSSGNLHPTEGYLVLPSLVGLGSAPAVYHYAPREHGLERRATLTDTGWRALTRTWPRDACLVGLSSIHWREAWKYGERAFRYCQHDTGHALAAVRLAAAALGWGLSVVSGTTHARMAGLLGLDREADFGPAEREEPECLVLVGPGVTSATRVALDTFAAHDADTAWHGMANTLSPDHGTDWPVIDDVATATRQVTSEAAPAYVVSLTPAQGVRTDAAGPSPTAEHVFLTRRSAVAMDARTSIAAATFFRMLARLLPSANGRAAPWDGLAWRPRLHLLLFVHRVDGVRPGLYALVRDPRRFDALRAAMRVDLQWQPVPGAPAGLPLFQLLEGDARAVAAQLSCGQDIAADGAFSAGMIADYLDALTAEGAPVYRRLFWEAGAIGQVLYLEAEAAGVRATGIGCFFDDPVHALAGFTTREWQSLYHFTVGGPVEDTRLSTLPAYPDHPDA